MVKCLICRKEIKNYKKCVIIIKTVGEWTKTKKSYYNTRLNPVCYKCVERMSFGNKNNNKPFQR